MDIASPRSLRDDVFASQPPDVAENAPLLPGDIVACAAGATIGKSSLYLFEESACYAGFLVRYRANDMADPRFISHWMQSTDYWDQIETGAVKSTIENFSASKYRALQVPLWELEEQRRIADFLDARVARVDQIIAARHDVRKGIEQGFQARRSGLVFGADHPRARPVALPWATVLPESWPVRRLSQVARMGTGHTPSRSVPEYWVDCDIPWLTTSDVHRFRRDEIDQIDKTEIYISELGLAYSAAVLHPAGTVALSRTASAGFSIVMGKAMATSQDFVTWTPAEDLRPKYLLHLLRTWRSYLLTNLAMGSTHKTIYFPDLMDLRVPLPPLPEQDRIVAGVDAAARARNGALAAVTAQIDLLQEYKQSLITAAVTGEFDVTTASTRIPG